MKNSISELEYITQLEDEVCFLHNELQKAKKQLKSPENEEYDLLLNEYTKQIKYLKETISALESELDGKQVEEEEGIILERTINGITLAQ